MTGTINRVLWADRVLRKLPRWTPPNVACTEQDEVVFEFFGYAPKKLTLYFTDDAIEYVRVWGSDINYEMDDGSIAYSSGDTSELVKLWLWMIEKEEDAEI